MYVFDTSALRFLPTSLLNQAKASEDFVLSPLSFYELLCHLDDTSRGLNYKRNRGNILKCMHCRILHDPFAYHAIAIGAERITNVTRFEEPTVISSLLGKLEVSQSLEDFYQSTIPLPDGTTGSCRGIAGNARRVLEQEENKYVEHITRLKEKLVLPYPHLASKMLTAQELFTIVSSGLREAILEYRV